MTFIFESTPLYLFLSTPAQMTIKLLLKYFITSLIIINDQKLIFYQ